MANLLDFLPFRQLDNASKDIEEKSLQPEEIKAVSKVMKVASLALGFQGTTFYFSNRAFFEAAPYDFDRIMQAADTDSYVKQALNKYNELFWKEGWKIVGENPDAVSYLYQRIDYMEIAMKRPFLDFLMEISDQYFKFANAFVVKARGDISSFFPLPLNAANGNQTVVGYYLIPTEQVRIKRDKFNRPKVYQQQTDPTTYSPTSTDPLWDAERVIHFYLDKKTGRAFGTPFLSSALDDVVALRQMEEDIQNLVHRELFPLYKYTVGTPEQPAEPDEITNAAFEIENMRAEGGIIVPHRHNIEAVNTSNSGVNASPYLDHFKERVAIGLGVAPHHLGMIMNGGNRSVTDRLDTALYDKIKKYQKLFVEMVRLHIFNELLIEGGFDPIANPVEDGVSDRCYFKFNEIDVDTQVKKETHIIQKYTNQVTTLPEARIELGLNPDYDSSELLSGIQGRAQIDISTAQAKVQSKVQTDTQNIDPNQNTDKQASAQKGQVNLPNKKKGPGNTIRPANQYGRKTSPDIKRSDDFLKTVEELLEKDYTVMYTNEKDVKEDK